MEAGKMVNSSKSLIGIGGVLLAVVAFTLTSSTPTSAQGPGVRDQVFQKAMFLSAPDNEFTVPSDKRLVIEFASGYASIPATTGCNILIEVILQTTVGGQFAHHHFVLNERGTVQGTALYIFSQDTLIYADPGTIVRLNYGVSNGTPCSPFASMTISGRLVAAM
jgi:hypothetical protein